MLKTEYNSVEKS